MSKLHNYISILIYKESRPDISRDGRKRYIDTRLCVVFGVNGVDSISYDKYNTVFGKVV